MKAKTYNEGLIATDVNYYKMQRDASRVCTSVQSTYVRKSSPLGFSKFDNSVKSVVKARGCPPSDFKI